MNEGAKTKFDAMFYGNKAAKSLGLPELEVFSKIYGEQHAFNYGIICQAIQCREQNKEFPNFITKNIGSATDAISRLLSNAASLGNLGDAQDARAWKQTLLDNEALKEALKTQEEEGKAKFEQADSLLRFWIEVSRLQDMDSLINTKDAKTFELSDIETDLPLNKDAQEAIVVISRQNYSKGNTRWTPIVGVWVKKQSNGEICPNRDAQLILNTEAFFDKNTNEPKILLDTPSIDKWVALEPALSAMAMEQAQPDQNPIETGKWQQFFTRWQEATRHWLGIPEGLAGLCVLLNGDHAAAFKVRIADSRFGMASEHTNALTRAVQQPHESELLHQALAAIHRPLRAQVMTLDNIDRRHFMGHMDSCKNGVRSRAFPLDPTQRIAAMAVAAAAVSSKPQLVPVNGPPGTGKTSFLRAALASIWVKAAIDEAPSPPVVYGVAATNQAVSNMIEAFGSVKSTKPDGPAYPWLEGLSSYGWFHPSRDAAKKRSDLMQFGWSDTKQTNFVPTGDAERFDQTERDDHQATLLERAANALDVEEATLNLETATRLTHQRILSLATEMNAEQMRFDGALQSVRHSWKVAYTSTAAERDFSLKIEEHSRICQELSPQLHSKGVAQELLKEIIPTQKWIESGWKTYIPKPIRNWLIRRSIEKLDVLSAKASLALSELGLTLPADLDDRIKTHDHLAHACEEDRRRLKHSQDKVAYFTRERDEYRLYLHKRHIDFMNLLKIYGVEHATPGLIQDSDYKRRRLSTIGLLARWLHKERLENESGIREKIKLIHLFESQLDTRYRVALFHWSARYWECRWMMLAHEPASDHAQLIERAMMLGVIIVATTHKLPALSNKRKADLLIMDEAGQCKAEIAAACIAMANNAVFVGDVKQLQPVAGISASMQDGIEHGISPQAPIPQQAKPVGGSGMALALLASKISDGEGQGITLLHHYRCVPEIIGYCNALMYQGRIINARTEPRMQHLSWMPAMSWVGVKGAPQQSAGSWNNPDEVQEICKWLHDNQNRLTDNGRFPLCDMVAIVTPLASQSETLKKALENTLGKDIIDGMVIGTVHKLQGAERPVVLFSLVQTASTNGSLMADRDGGMLMNVAVSRARDAFVIFADRNTLKPTPSDSLTPATRIAGSKPSAAMQRPIAALGRWMRKHGERLYPGTLVVIEAPGKALSVEKALGCDVAVVATKGSLRTSQLTEKGLEWGHSPQPWLQELAAHSGLVKSIVIATDDDLAGELIGLHAAEDAVSTIAPPARTAGLTIRRMRFADMTADTLKTAYDNAGNNFDGNMLSAALTREFANHADMQVFKEKLPQVKYYSAQIRDAVDWLETTTRGMRLPDGELAWEVHCEMETNDQSRHSGFVAEDRGILSRPARMSHDTAIMLAQQLREHPDLGQAASLSTIQQPGMYPANTTARVLALAVDELGMSVQHAQDHLNALYLQGAQTNEERGNDE